MRRTGSRSTRCRTRSSARSSRSCARTESPRGPLKHSGTPAAAHPRRLAPPATLTCGCTHHRRVRHEASTAAPHRSDRPCFSEPLARHAVLVALPEGLLDLGALALEVRGVVVEVVDGAVELHLVEVGLELVVAGVGSDEAVDG